MTGGGGGGLSIGRSPSRARWVGRASLLEQWPAAPQWLKYCVLASGLFGVQLVWSCEMAQASPYLLSLGLSKSLMSLVFVAGPLSGLIVQPIVGVLSDGCRSSFGRRRPFLVAGCAASALALLLLGFASNVAGWVTTTGGLAHKRLTITLAVIAVYIIDFSINVVQAMDRSLLVDVVPSHLQPAANAWASRLFGFGAVLGYWVGGIDLVWLTGGWLGDQQLKVLTVFTSVALCVCHAVTIVFVKERVLIESADDGLGDDGEVGSTVKALRGIWVTFKTLPKPIQQILNVQFASWVGWFPVLFFSTTWVAETYSLVHWGSKDLSTAPTEIVDLATRAGTRALFLHSVVALCTSIILPPFVAPLSDSHNPSSSPYLRPSSPLSSPLSKNKLLSLLPTLPVHWLTLPVVWTISNFIFSMLLFSTYFTKTVGGSSFIIALAGFCWAVTNWAPFSLLGDLILRVTGPALPSTPIPLDPVSHHHSPWVPPPLSPVEEEVNRRLISTPISSVLDLAETTDYPNNATIAPTPITAYFDVNEPPPTTTRAKVQDSDEANWGGREEDLESITPKKKPRPQSYLFPENNGPILYSNQNSSSTHSLTHDVDPYSYSTPREDKEPNVLQIRHSDSFDLNDRNASSLDEEHHLDLGPSGGRRGSNNLNSAGGGGIGLGESSDEWELEAGEGEDDGGGDQAGVILGLHNIHIVIPQFFVTAISALIFAIFAPNHSLPVGHGGGGAGLPSNETIVDEITDLVKLALRQVEDVVVEAEGWDALGMIFRIGGVAAFISAVLSWKMTRDRERERVRRSRGLG